MFSVSFQPFYPLQQKRGCEEVIACFLLQVFAKQIEHLGFLLFDSAFSDIQELGDLGIFESLFEMEFKNPPVFLR